MALKKNALNLLRVDDLLSICAPPPMAIDGRPPAKSNPDLDAALWQAFSGDVERLVAGEEVLIHRYDLPDWHPERDAGLPGDYLILGVDDVLRER